MTRFRATMIKGKVTETVEVDLAAPEGRAQLQAMIERAISDWVEAKVSIRRLDGGAPRAGDAAASPRNPAPSSG